MKHEWNKEDWKYHGQWVQAPLSCAFWPKWNRTKSVSETFGNIGFDIFLPVNCHFYNRKSDEEKIYDFIKELLNGPADRQEEFLARFERVGQKYEKSHLSVLDKRNTLDLKEYTEELFDTYTEIIGFWTFALFIADALEKYMVDSGIVQSDVELMTNISEMNVSVTWLEEQNIEVRDLIERVKKIGLHKEDISEKSFKKYPDIFTAIKAHTEKFDWFGTHHWQGDGYGMDKCIELIREEFDKVGKKDKNKKDPKENAWKLLALVTYWRTHCAEVAAAVVCRSRPQLKDVGKLWGLDYDGLVYLSGDEILEGLRTGKYDLPKDLEARKGGYACVSGREGTVDIITGDDFKKLKDVFLERVDLGNIRECKGVVASRGGTVSGSVKIILEPKDFARFEIGNILVAPETTPDFVPIMKKAAAIVTDRGGVTSHAAIVSRELGIPCVIGTKIATRVFKDGDLVEVDAEKGIVKMLK